MLGIRMKVPVHPGDFVNQEIIDPLGLTVEDAARVLQVPDVELSSVLDQEVRLSPEMALRLEKAFGLSMDTLMRMQCSYDIAMIRKREDEIEVERFSAKG